MKHQYFKTDLLWFVNAHFKPFAAIGYEYNKVLPNSGTASFGQSITFSIPQFGDFFNDMVVHTQIAAASASTVTGLPAFPAYIGLADQATTTTYSVSATEDAPVLNSYTRYTYNYVNQQGTVLDRTTAIGQNFVRYVEYPGERLFSKVKFEVNGNPLDDYTSEAVMFHQKFRVAPGKLTGWKRLVGQEVPVEAFTNLATISGTSPYGAAAVGLLDVNGAAARCAPVNATYNTRQMSFIVNGPQTPKATQPVQDWWIPLLFWFNKDARLSIASVSIPYGQRFITIDLAPADDIVTTAAGNVSLRLTTEVVANATGTAAGAAVTSYARYATLCPVQLSSSDSGVVTPNINKCELYINNIFVNPEIHDVYIKRIGFSLIRVYRFQTQEEKVSNDRVLLSNLKWPIETLYAGMRPKFNITKPTISGLAVTAGNVNFWRDWDRLTRLVDQTVACPMQSEGLTGYIGAGDNTVLASALIGTNALAGTASQLSQIGKCNLVYPESFKTLQTIKIQAHGIDIYQEIDDEFFADYQPYTYGGYNVVTPEDPGAVMINFCLYPGTYQPSGHLNISRAREFYFLYTSAFVGVQDAADPQSPASATADLLVLAIAINFLLISDGSAVLRYST